jgi:hypothetical protein
MPHYMVGGYDDYPMLHLVPVNGEHGIDLPAQLYHRWKDARAELEAAQRAVVAHVRAHGGGDTLPNQLWEHSERRPGGARPG